MPQVRAFGSPVHSDCRKSAKRKEVTYAAFFLEFQFEILELWVLKHNELKCHFSHQPWVWEFLLFFADCIVGMVFFLLNHGTDAPTLSIVFCENRSSHSRRHKHRHRYWYSYWHIDVSESVQPYLMPKCFYFFLIVSKFEVVFLLRNIPLSDISAWNEKFHQLLMVSSCHIRSACQNFEFMGYNSEHLRFWGILFPFVREADRM